MRNRIDDELQHIRKEARTVKFALPAHSTYEALLKQHQLNGWSPPRAQVKKDFVWDQLYLPKSPCISLQVKNDFVWDQLLAASAQAKERQAALRAIVDLVRAEEAWAKVVVFAPAGSAFESAADALRALRRPVLIGDPSDPGSTDRIDKFSRPDIRDPDAPLVLPMRFDPSSWP